MSRCLADQWLLDLAEGRVAIDADVERHLGTCAECRRVLAAAARDRGGLAVHAAAPVDASEPSWDELGQGVIVAGRYELEEFLGAGGMGVVWRAQRVTDREEVALKIAKSLEPELVRRFDREAKAAASIDHPNVVRILDVIESAPARGPAIAQELLIGETLEAHLTTRGRLALREACRVVASIASAVAAMSARGVVHRDLKPQNVFVTSTRVVVLDFGIAKLTPEWGVHSKITRSGATVGSPRYMAPEQVYGANVDARADVWALGAILFRALAGTTAIAGDTMGDALKALQKGLVRDITEFRSDLPIEIVALVRTALAIDPALRTVAAGAFHEAMSRHA